LAFALKPGKPDWETWGMDLKNVKNHSNSLRSFVCQLGLQAEEFAEQKTEAEGKPPNYWQSMQVGMGSFPQLNSVVILYIIIIIT
jgi:hypothetical protein